MSDLYHCYGYVAVLKTPVPEDDREAFMDEHYDEGIRLTYDGSMISINYNANESYDERQNIYRIFLLKDMPRTVEEFVEDMAEFGIDVDPQRVQPYCLNWYNGGDFPIDEMTIPDVFGE